MRLLAFSFGLGIPALALAAVGLLRPAEAPPGAPSTAIAGKQAELAVPLTEPALLLPDLVVAPPLQLLLDEDGRALRFSTTIENRGRGPLDLVGVLDPSGEDTFAYQRLASADGGFELREVGGFKFDSEHAHWHFGNFVTTELWTYGEGGRLESLMASTGKLAFCIIDTAPADPPHFVTSEEPSVTVCGRDAQAISVGWQDTYDASLPGQALELGDAPDGRYALRAWVDPDELLTEDRETNNELTVHIEIREGTVELLGAP